MSTSDPIEPAGERTGEPLSLERLLATYTAWSSADVVETARRRAHDAGDTERVAALEAMAREGPSATEALAAAHELTSLLEGWRWHTVRAAREAGASWDDIAAAIGTDPATARAEFLERVERASEQATAAGFEFRDEQRYRDAARNDTAHDAGAEEQNEDVTEQDPDDRTHRDIDRLDPESSTVTDDHQHQHAGNEQERAQAGWPVPDLSRPLSEIGDRELIKRAELDEAVAMTGIGGDPDAAWADLDATRVEAERRALDQPPDSIPAQVAGYISLVSDDHTGALHTEATSWRHDLDQALPPADTTGGALTAAAGSIAENAVSAGARMSAELPGDEAGSTGAEFDLERLDEVTERFGYAVFDPDAPGGVRAPTEREYADLLAELTPTPRTTDDNAIDTVTAETDHAAALGAGFIAPGWPGAAEAQVDEVERRTADPAFGYDPAAEWGDPTYREPRTQDEADARTAHLEVQRAAHPPAPRPAMRAPTEVEDALEEAELDAELSHRAHDLDPEPAARVAGLEAPQNLRPLPGHEPDQETGSARYSGPEVEFEDQLFRRSLEHTVPVDVPNREQAIERAVDVARDRLWTHGLITYPEQALALTRESDPADDIHPRPSDDDREADRDTDGRGGQGWVDGPWTDTDGRRWASTGDWAATTACENATLERPSVPDDPARLRDLLEQVRSQIAARDTAVNAATQVDEDAARREQLSRWHEDDRAHPAAAHASGDAVAGEAGEELVIRCFGDPDAPGEQQ